MILSDYVFLSRTVPEESKKYGYGVCSAGYSEEHGGLVRIYPLGIRSRVKARMRCTVQLERKSDDNRIESYKLQYGEASIWGIQDRRPREEIAAWLLSIKSSSIEELNANRRSLGVLVPRDAHGYFTPRDSSQSPTIEKDTYFAYSDMDNRRFGAKSLDVEPRIRFWDELGKKHQLQIREWGVYEWCRKNPLRRDLVWQNIGLDQKLLFVVGNHLHHRNTWLIIKVFRVDDQGWLF